MGFRLNNARIFNQITWAIDFVEKEAVILTKLT